MATSLSSFLPYVLPHVPGCPKMAAKEEVLRACIEFCEKSLVWKNTPAAINVVSGTATYAISVPSGGQVVKLEALYHNGERLDPMTTRDLEGLYTDWTTETGTPLYYTQSVPTSVILVPEPDTSITSGLRFQGVYKPTRTATTVEDFLYNDYAEEISAGAVARLLATHGKTWTNPDYAPAFMNKFMGGIGLAKIRASKNFTTQSLRVCNRPFI
jgi:hypothetical protein